ncbi:putative nuclease HARBI1 [Ostrinia furnacalis]|uniref:putative nuclease HARBI1 n=1 Tax=Ostrinia furnacalis TaxID=93504 RepID=UPI00103B1087|nr:putative nuclease HARBI1 [Ostrinia furnacalis]
MDYMHYFNIIDMWDDDEDQSNRKGKMYKKRADPFLLDDAEFKYKYRFSKEYILKIVNFIRNDIIQDRRGCGISPELQVLAALRTWARQEVQDDAADIHGLSQQSITNVCRRVALALAKRAKDFIYMPRNLSEQEEVITGFREICGFRHAIGAIDCTHVRIKKVGGLSSQYYINRKGFYSLNIQVVCDAKLKIRDIVARWRGSTHDSRIFNESTIKERFERGEFCGRLIGDAGYALTPFLFTPVNNPQSQAEEAFTVNLENAKLYTVALAVLHNIAIDMGEELEDLELPASRQVHPVTIPQAGSSEHVQGQAARRNFINRYF